MAGRRCPGRITDHRGNDVGCPRILTNGERYCPQHAREYEARRGTKAQRGYGAPHQRLRAAWQVRIDAGEAVRCWRCGKRITGTFWHLGHDDHNRHRYRGPECVGCNTSAGGKQGRASQVEQPLTDE